MVHSRVIRPFVSIDSVTESCCSAHDAVLSQWTLARHLQHSQPQQQSRHINADDDDDANKVCVHTKNCQFKKKYDQELIILTAVVYSSVDRNVQLGRT